MTAVPSFRAMQSINQPINPGAQLYQFNKVFSEFNNQCYNNSDQPQELNGHVVQPYAFHPTVAGYYLVGAMTRLNLQHGGEHVVQIYKNEGCWANGSDIDLQNNDDINYGSTVSTVVYLDGVADYVQAYVFANKKTHTLSGGDEGYEYSGFYGIFLNAGNVMVCDNDIPKMTTVPNFRAMQSRDQRINTGATLYQFNKVLSEFGNQCYNNSDHPQKLNGRVVQPYAFRPTVAGYYLVGATTRLNLQRNGEHVVQIYKNGSPYANGSDIDLILDGINYGSTVSTVIYLDGVDDYVQAYVFTNKTTHTLSGGGEGYTYSGFYGIFLNAGEVMVCDNGIPKMIAVPNFRSMQSRDQVINPGATLYQFNKVFSEFDNRCYNNSDQPRELNGRVVQPYAFHPTVAGYYAVGATTRRNHLQHGGEHVVQIYKNGSPYANGSDIDLGTGAHNGTTVYTGINYGSTVSTVVYLDGVDDYVQAYVFANKKTSTASGGDDGREYSGFYGIFLNAGNVAM